MQTHPDLTANLKVITDMIGFNCCHGQLGNSPSGYFLEMRRNLFSHPSRSSTRSQIISDICTWKYFHIFFSFILVKRLKRNLRGFPNASGKLGVKTVVTTGSLTACVCFGMIESVESSSKSKLMSTNLEPGGITKKGTKIARAGPWHLYLYCHCIVV